ncbi:MAG: ASKHA domain-containing protein, partial [Clostridiales bacterium]|nr:ASKHA domain-containing protein [Clostridiales bacterium]
MYQVFFIREEKNIYVSEGVTVLEAEIQAGLKPDAPCGGAGKCGKCLVRIADILSHGDTALPCEDIDTKISSRNNIALSYEIRDSEKTIAAGAYGKPVRACQTRVTADICVDTLSLQTQEYAILTEGFLRPVTYHPGLSVHKIRLDKPETGDKRSDWDRMTEQLAQDKPAEPFAQIHPTPELASSLYDRRAESAQWYAIHTDDKILDLRREPGRVCFAAFDIGTTTVAGYLLDAKDGRTLAIESRLNPQVQYGADVIMRANYALEHGTEILSACIREAVNEMLQILAKKASVCPEDIFQISIVGNTCMHHLFLGISPASLVHAPYTPAISTRLTLRAAAYGLHVHPNAQLLMLPVIAGYVGADTCACLMATRPDQEDNITLLLDIGTNGEMVLGNRKRLVACSTAAGPAFEGAKITCGMRGAAGA